MSVWIDPYIGTIIKNNSDRQYYVDIAKKERLLKNKKDEFEIYVKNKETYFREEEKKLLDKKDKLKKRNVILIEECITTIDKDKMERLVNQLDQSGLRTLLNSVEYIKCLVDNELLKRL
jgi:endo-alpha-1,4-polygalactosaminidase (GH114 family)